MRIKNVVLLGLSLASVKASPIERLWKRFLANEPSETQMVNTTTFVYPQTQSVELFPMNMCRGITLEDATIDQLQGYFDKGVLSSEDVVRCYLDRYFQLNSYVNGVLQVNPDAISIAQERDRERAAGVVRSPLHGIPF
ncbi:AHL_G0006520.mRNA.1.CDS.1 [Saccharomyces cerevisiae]|nr:AHL_G0006520.mRNA.1.CDS.1 [Saccharomyces cerevisiae]CAI6526461.1 AHL_G0006520.mRNA.1.CDS.1 [Saccharomyces cerevisiae]